MFLFLEENIYGLVHQFCVMFSGDILLQLFDHAEAPPFFLIAHVIRHGAFGERTGARRVTGKVDDIELQVAELLYCLLKLFFRFPAETDDDIGTDGNVRDDIAYPGDQVAVLCIGITPPHAVQNLIASGLGRNLNMVHHAGQFCDRFQQFICHPVRMGCQETDALQTFDVVQATQKLRKLWIVFIVEAVTVNDLPQQGDFLHPLSRKGTGV